MADAAANTAPVKDDAIAHLYGRKGATVGDGFVKYAENQFAHAVGLSASDKGKTPYIDANGDYARLAIGANGSIVYAASGLPAWLGPGTANQLLRMNSGATAPEWATVANNLVQISKQTVSSPVASVVFSSLAASGYSKHILVANDVVSAVAATNDTLNLHVSTDNGSTWKTTSGDYYGSGGAATILCSTAVAGSTSTFQHGSFAIEINGLGNSARATNAVRLWDIYATSTTGVAAAILVATQVRMRMAAEADNAMRVISTGGSNITAGTFVLYGVVET